MESEDDSGCVVVVDDPKSKTKNDEKRKTQPPYVVIIHNDDYHTVEYVVTGIQKVFGYDLQKCISFTLEVHNSGLSVVWSGSKEVAELKQEQLLSLGPDMFANKPVEFPLKVTIEPAK